MPSGEFFIVNSECGRILIRGVNWVGDAVMTMPAVRALRDNFPDSRIGLLVKQWVMELFRNDPNVDVLLEYKKEYSGIVGKFRAARDIRRDDFECAFLLQNAIDAAIVCFLAGIPQRTGYARDGRGILLTRSISVDDKVLRLHHIEYYLNMLNRAGLSAEYRLPWIYPRLDDRLGARQRLSHLKRPVVGLNPGAAYGSAKRWHPERFARVAMRVISELEGSVVIFGSEKEYPISTEILDSMEGDIVPEAAVLNLAGKTSLYELCDLVAECDILVSNDSGPMHICYAVGTPIVALFGSTSPELTGPPDCSFDGAEFGYRFRVIRSNIECSPCFERKCRYGHLECMERISADTVFDAVKDLLPRNRAVFFDRDGTLCRDAHYLNSFDDFEPFPGTERLRVLKERGYRLIGITNQSGIARGIVDERFVREVNDVFINKYGFDAFYYCPHHPDDRCACRKPMHGMLLRAAAEHGINLRESYYVGDRESDMAAARLAGTGAIHITTTTSEELAYAGMRTDSLEGCISLIE